MLYVLWKHPSPGMWNQERCQNALARGLEPGDMGEHRSQELTLCIRAKGCMQLDALVCEMDQMVNQKHLEESLKEKGTEYLAHVIMRNVGTEQGSRGQNPGRAAHWTSAQ